VLSSQKRPARAIAYSIWAIWFVVFIGAGILLRDAPLNAPLIRFILLLAVFSAVSISLPGVIAHICSFTRGQRAALFVLPGLLFMAQIMERDAQMFPFVTWFMYTEEVANPERYDELKIWGYTEAGQRVPVRYKVDNIGLLLTTVFRIEDLYERIKRDPSSPESERMKTRIHKTLQALAKRHNQLHPDKHIVEIAFEKTPMTIDWDAGGLIRGNATGWREPVSEAGL
jgi:hypothetical protein